MSIKTDFAFILLYEFTTHYMQRYIFFYYEFEFGKRILVDAIAES